MAWHEELDRGQRARHTTMGVPPGTWEAPPFPPKKSPVRVPADQRSRLAARGRPQAPRAKSGGRTGGTTGTRATEPGRMDGGESESRIVPLKPGNRPTGPGGGKAAPCHGTERGDRCRDHPNLGSISTRLRRIAQLAREDPDRSFLSLAHYIDEHWLQEADSRTRKDGAVGVDGQTAEQYAEHLVDNLRLPSESRSEAVARGAGCGKSARPDLWGGPAGQPAGSTRFWTCPRGERLPLSCLTGKSPI